MMAREKRPLEKDVSSEGMPEEKRQRVPALASVIVEAVKMDSLQKLCSTLEPLLRRVDIHNYLGGWKLTCETHPFVLAEVSLRLDKATGKYLKRKLLFIDLACAIYMTANRSPSLVKFVGEEVERVLAKLTPAKVGFRSSPKRIQGPDSRSLRLQFRNKLALPLFTGSKLEGEQGSAIHVVLQDVNSGQVVTGGTESCTKLEVVVLEGDFSADDDEDWPQDDFENHEVRERDGKRPLLTGDLSVTLKEGVGTLGELTFTDNSSWIRSRKFRLGVKISSGYCEGLRIREAKTEAFTVKDHRGELYKKHYPPALHDEVWRLDKIGKDGAFHKRLNQAGLQTVEDFLRLVVMDPQKLRNILGNGMSNKMWEGTVEHAKTCVLSGRLHVYYADDKQNIGVIFNNIFQLMGLIADGQYMSVDSLSDSEKVYVDKLVKVAYENWENVVEYDGEALIGIKPYKLRGIDAHTEDPISGHALAGHQIQTSASSQHTGPIHSMAMQRSLIGGQVSPELKLNLKHSNQGISLTEHENTQTVLNTGPNYSPSQSSILSISHQNFMHGVNVPMTGLALGLPQTSMGLSSVPNISSTMPSSIMPASDWPRYKELRGQDSLPRTLQVDELFSEDELRAKSLEILENEDMHLQIQQLLCMFNAAAGEVPPNPYRNVQGDESFPFGSFFPAPDLNVTMDRARSNGRANVGWLKLKAALRWGIFIRKRAAARRAQLEEVEDD